METCDTNQWWRCDQDMLSRQLSHHRQIAGEGWSLQYTNYNWSIHTAWGWEGVCENPSGDCLLHVLVVKIGMPFCRRGNYGFWGAGADSSFRLHHRAMHCISKHMGIGDTVRIPSVLIVLQIHMMLSFKWHIHTYIHKTGMSNIRTL